MKYYIHFVGTFSKFTWIFQLKCKSRFPDVFVHFKNKVWTYFGRKSEIFIHVEAHHLNRLDSLFYASVIVHRIYTHDKMAPLKEA